MMSQGKTEKRNKLVTISL